MADVDKPKSMIEKAVEQSEAAPSKPGQAFVSTKAKRLDIGKLKFLKNPVLLRKIKLVLAAVVLVVVVLVLYAVIHKPPFYKTTSLTDSGYTYTFKFASNARSVATGSANELVGDNLTKKNQLQLNIYKSFTTEDCHKAYPFLSAPFTTTIQGAKYSTCSNTSGTDLITIFKYNSNWHQLLISSVDHKTAVDQKTAQTIIGSVKVNK